MTYARAKEAIDFLHELIEAIHDVVSGRVRVRGAAATATATTAAADAEAAFRAAFASNAFAAGFVEQEQLSFLFDEEVAP
jgi:hypothetical protein